MRVHIVELFNIKKKDIKHNKIIFKVEYHHGIHLSIFFPNLQSK